jgi:hypothetical protein
LLSAEGAQLIVSPPSTSLNGLTVSATLINNTRREDPLEQAHRILCEQPPITFQELSWPTEEQLEGEAGQCFSSSAQLLVDRLLRLKDGPACLRTMLAELPQHYNWQFAFLLGFEAHFQRPLDVEEWWALQLDHFTGHSLANTWPAEEGWQKLPEAVRSPADIRAGTNQLPLRLDMPLQFIVRDVDHASQVPALRAKLRELEMIRLRVTPELVPLVDDYHRVIEAYLQKHDKLGFVLPFRKKAAQRHFARATASELDAIDARRELLQPKTGPAPKPGSSAPEALN